MNNNRLLNIDNLGISSFTNNSSINRVNCQLSLPQVPSSVNNYSSISSNVDRVVGNNLLNSTTTSVIVDPRKNFQSRVPSNLPLTSLTKSLFKSGIIEKPEESDLSEDDRLPDPRGEETETAPEAEGEEESITRCIWLVSVGIQ